MYIAGGTPTVEYSGVEGGWAWVPLGGGGPPDWGDGNIILDPCFTDPENDNYRLTVDSPCINVGGDDTYVGNEANRPGMAIFDDRFRARGGVSDYFADTTVLGLFLDVGGNDTYWTEQQNNTHWLDEPDSPNWTEPNFSVGVDRDQGTVSLRPRPEKVPTGRP